MITEKELDDMCKEKPKKEKKVKKIDDRLKEALVKMKTEHERHKEQARKVRKLLVWVQLTIGIPAWIALYIFSWKLGIIMFFLMTAYNCGMKASLLK